MVSMFMIGFLAGLISGVIRRLTRLMTEEIVFEVPEHKPARSGDGYWPVFT